MHCSAIQSFHWLCVFFKIEMKLTLATHLRFIERSASIRFGLMRLDSKFFDDDLVIFPVLEYGSTVWDSDGQRHLALLDRIVNRVSSLNGVELQCDLSNRRRVASLILRFTISEKIHHIPSCIVQSGQKVFVPYDKYNFFIHNF